MITEPTVAVFLPWWGNPPGWERQFMKRAAAVRSLHPILVGDAAKWMPDLDLQRIPCTMDEFEALASAVSGVRIKKDDTAYCRGQSLCELRPLMADMYRETILGFPWWGYGDWDVVWGDWDAFLTDAILSHYDLISTNAATVNGPLTLFRNTLYMATLYRARLDILQSPLGQQHLDEGGLNGIVQQEIAQHRLRALFLQDMGSNEHHQRWNKCCVQNGKLYRFDEQGNIGGEILKFHFNRWDRWPCEG